MNRPTLGWYASLVALVGILFTPSVSASEPARLTPQSAAAAITDVALDQQMQLSGQVVTPTGEPVPAASLRLSQRDAQPLRADADDAGHFRLRLEQGGVYQLAMGQQVVHLRVWTHAAAPPDCPRQLVLVAGDVVRGQSGKIPCTQINPWLVAGVVAAAVAIPVVLSNHRSDRGDGS
jgi:hypothetical protein